MQWKKKLIKNLEAEWKSKNTKERTGNLPLSFCSEGSRNPVETEYSVQNMKE